MTSLKGSPNRKVVVEVFQNRFGLLVALVAVLAACGNVQAPQREQHGGSGFEIHFGIQGIGAEGGLASSFVGAANWVTEAGEKCRIGVGTHLSQPESARPASSDGAHLVSWSLRLTRRATVLCLGNSRNIPDDYPHLNHLSPCANHLDHDATHSCTFKVHNTNHATSRCNAGKREPGVSGVLAPGESLEFIDGISIHANSSEFGQPMRILVEHVESEDLPAPFPSYETPITPFYRISSDTSWSARRMAGLDVQVRVPQAPEGYRVIAQLFVLSSSLYHPPEGAPGVWAKTWIDINLETSTAHISLRRLDPEGAYFTFTFARLR